MISILMTTRGRAKNCLSRSIQSIINTSNSKDNFEIIFGVDNDDIETISYIDSLDTDKLNFQKVEFEPLGYKSLYVYQNTMAEFSNGTQIWLLADDVEILTRDWDCIMKNYENEMYLNISLGSSYDNWPYSLIPLISKKWYEITGRISANSQTDCWLGAIAYDLQIIKTIPVICNLVMPSDGSKHDTERISTQLKSEQLIDKNKLKNFTKTEDLGIQIPSL